MNEDFSFCLPGVSAVFLHSEEISQRDILFGGSPGKVGIDGILAPVQ